MNKEFIDEISEAMNKALDKSLETVLIVNVIDFDGTEQELKIVIGPNDVH